MLANIPMFTPGEMASFRAHGLIKRQRFLSDKKLADVRSLISDHLTRIGIRRDGCWHFEQTTPDSGMALIKPLDRHPAVVGLAGPEALLAASELAGGRPVLPGHPGLLFTLPNTSTWVLPHQNWHTDFPRLPQYGVPGVQIFAILETVERCGGGTLAVTGSHRLLNDGIRISSAELRKRLRREAYFAELMSSGTGDRMRFLDLVCHVG